ncbi:MAG: hypothetical protein E7575_04210 [Ruminococcaceae bacterium]|nr:hypothetical protein [Oscillospiraceae bacterium]
MEHRSNIKKPIITVSFILAGILASLLIFAAVFVDKCCRTLICEAGDTPDFSHITENGFVSSLCKIKTDIKSFPTDHVGTKKAELCFFGFYKKEIKITVSDTKAPVLSLSDLWITNGCPLSPEDFVKELSDSTAVVLSFEEGAPVSNKSGSFSVLICATDEGGNTTTEKCTLTVSENRSTAPFESGTDEDIIKHHLDFLSPEALNYDLEGIPNVGKAYIKAKKDNTAYIFEIEFIDTVPPRGKAVSLDIPLGTVIEGKDLVPIIDDSTNVSIDIVSPPDCKKAGEYNTEVILTDEGKNQSKYFSTVYVHDINTDVTVEAKSNNDILASLIFGEGGEREGLRIMHENATDDMVIGENTLSLWGSYSKLPVTVNVIDTVAPVFYSKTVHVPEGSIPPAIDLVSSYYDSSSVAFSFKGDIPKGAVGSCTVTLVATDTSGNSSSKNAQIVFVADREKPYLEGVRDITVNLGEEPDYFDGIQGFDTVKGPLKVNCDDSQVDVSTPGTYKILYSVDDGNGNITSEHAYVTVLAYKKVCLDVENIMQFPLLPCGCEAVSLAIVLKYEGLDIEPEALYTDYMPKGDYVNGNPWKEYIGDPFTEGMGCYAPCLCETGNSYLENIGSKKKVYDISGLDIQECKRYIDRKIPVIIWGTMWMLDDDSLCWTNVVDGETVVWHSVSHCLVLIGYTDTGYIFCDPMRGIVEYTQEETERAFEINFRQACIVE